MSSKLSKKITFIDVAALILVIAAIFMFLDRMTSTLDYHWQWGALKKYFFFLDDETGKVHANILIKGFLTTIKLSFWASILALVIGTVSGIAGARGASEQKMLSRIYVETVRNIPSLVLVIIFYYFVSSQILDAMAVGSLLRQSPDAVRGIAGFLFAGPDQINAFLSAVFALGLYEGAYVSEIVRGGINSISTGQWEAAGALGLSRYRTFMVIILPQAFQKTAFPLAGQFISTIKDSAIVSVISIQELTFQGMEVMASTFLTFEVWITITGMYFILTFSCSRAVAFLESRTAQRQ